MSEKKTYQQQTLFADDSLANLTVMPGSEKARQMTVTSGRNISVLLKRSDPVGLLVKTCLESVQPYSTRCYLTWKIWTTPRGRLLYRLAPSMPHIEGIGFSLLPTPTTQEVEHPDAELTETGRRKTKDGKNSHSLNLADTIKMYPTPRCSDGMTGQLRNMNGKNSKGRLEDIIAQQEGPGGQLNPTWVEWLMGFPIGWTDLEHSEMP